MGVGAVRDFKLADDTLAKPLTVDPWVRNPSWLPITDPSANEEKFVGLHAVFTNSAYVSFAATGSYHVDWGDGSSEDVASGVTASHQYTYADADLANTNGPVTFTDSGDLVTRTSHGYRNGDQVQFYDIVSTTGITSGATYYVINATDNTFQISATAFGSAVALTTNGSGALLPYKQAIITITALSGNNITELLLHKKHASAPSGHMSGFLDITMSLPDCTNMTLATYVRGATSATIGFRILEQINIVASKLVDLSNLFYNLSGLRKVKSLNLSTAATVTRNAVTFQDTGDTVTWNGHPLSNDEAVSIENLGATTGPLIGSKYYVANKTANTFQLVPSVGSAVQTFTTNGTGSIACKGINFFGAFQSCTALREIGPIVCGEICITEKMFASSGLLEAPYLNLAPASTTTYMFYGANLMVDAPSYDLSNAVSSNSMFWGCQLLRRMPVVDLPLVKDALAMHGNNYALTRIPKLSAPNATMVAQIFQNCSGVREVGDLSFPSATNPSYMFNGCAALLKIGSLVFGAAKITTITYMFYGCYLLTEVPYFDTSAVTTFASAFYNCYSLLTIPKYSTAAVTTFNSAFYNCYSLAVVPAIVVSGPTAASGYNSMFYSCASLESILATGFKYTFTIAGCKLSAAALDALYTNLATVTTQTITVTSNPGISGDTPTIATAKGWTVTGS